MGKEGGNVLDGNKEPGPDRPRFELLSVVVERGEDTILDIASTHMVLRQIRKEIPRNTRRRKMEHF